MNSEKICPLCGKPNNCQAELPQTCWCNNVTVPKELIEQVPEQLKRKACICLNCIEQFNNENDSEPAQRGEVSLASGEENLFS